MNVTSQTIQQGDVLTIGGRAFEVLNLIQLPGGAKALRFTTGEVLNIHSMTQLSVVRTRRER